MGVTIAVTRAALNTSTGTQDITTSDLGGLTPKAVRLIATRATTDGTAADGAGLYVGASDGTNEWTQGYEDRHAQASMDSEMEQDTTANRILTIYDGTASDVVEATINFDSFITDGVRINITDAPANAYLITAEFFAGSDLTAHVGTVSLGNTSNALIAVTSVGFEADIVLTQLLEGTSVSTGSVSMGVIHNDRGGTITQRCIAFGQRNGFASSVMNSVTRNDCSVARLIETSGSLDWTASAQSFDSSGWDWQLGNSRAPTNHHAGWIALRFGASPVVSSKVYTYSTPTSTGSNTDTGPGFTPQYVMYLATRTATANTSEVDADAGTMSIVVADANEVYTSSIASEDGAADSNTQSLSDNQINLTTHTGANGHQATLSSMGGSGPVWSYSVTDATARQWGALAIEAITSSPVTIVLDTATLTAAGGAIDQISGAVSKLFDTATLTSTGQAFDVVPGAVVKSVDTALVTVSGQLLDVITISFVLLDTSSLVANGQSVQVIKGQVSIALDEAIILSNGEIISLETGAVITVIDTASLIANGNIIDILLGGDILLDTATLIASGITVDIVPGAVAVNIDAALLSVSASVVDLLPGAISLFFDTANIQAVAQILSIAPGAYVVTFDTAETGIVSYDITILAPFSGNNVSLDTALLQISSEIAIMPGNVSVSVDTALLLAVAPDVVISALLAIVKHWTLSDRSTDFNLQSRSTDFSIEERSNEFTLNEDDR